MSLSTGQKSLLQKLWNSGGTVRTAQLSSSEQQAGADLISGGLCHQNNPDTISPTPDGLAALDAATKR